MTATLRRLPDDPATNREYSSIFKQFEANVKYGINNKLPEENDSKIRILIEEGMIQPEAEVFNFKKSNEEKLEVKRVKFKKKYPRAKFEKTGLTKNYDIHLFTKTYSDTYKVSCDTSEIIKIAKDYQEYAQKHEHKAKIKVKVLSSNELIYKS